MTGGTEIPENNRQYRHYLRIYGPYILLFLLVFAIVAIPVYQVLILTPHISPVPGIPGEYTPLSLTTTERAWIGSHPVIRVCPDVNYPPFEVYTKTGGYEGISAELLREIADITGFTLVVVHENDWGRCVQNVASGDADILGAVYISDLRDEYLSYSLPYYHSTLPIITRDSVQGEITLDDLTGKSVASVTGYTTTLLIREKYPQINLVEVPDTKTGLEKVSFGSVDAFFGDLAASTYYVGAEGLSNLRVAGRYIPPEEEKNAYSYAFGVRKDYPELVSILNKGLQAIPKERRNEIFRSWISPTLTRPDLTGTLTILIAGSTGILVFILLIVILWNRTLNRAIEEKTREITSKMEELNQTAGQLKLTRFSVDQNHAMIFWIDQDGRIRDMNATAIRITGYTREDLLTLNVLGPDTPMDPETIRTIMTRIPSREPISMEGELRIRDGTLPVHLYLYSFTFEGEEWFCAELNDLSNWKLAEHRIEESEQKYRDLFRNVNDVIIVFDLGSDRQPGQIIEVNDPAETLLGYTREELLTRRFTDLDGKNEISLATALQACIDTSCTFEWTLVSSAGREIPVEVRLHFYQQDADEFGFALIRDITERKAHEIQREAAIRQIQKNLTELSLLNDGIRNPLTIILSIAENLCPDGFAAISKQIDRIDEVINTLDNRWNESEKILTYLRKYYNIRVSEPDPDQKKP